MGAFVIYIKFIVHSYPHLDKSKSTKEIKYDILDILKADARNISIENIDKPTKGGIPVEYIQASEILFQKLKRCKNDKECIINVYNSHMDRWVSNTMRKNIKALYMIKRFGVVGEHINENFGWMY